MSDPSNPIASAIDSRPKYVAFNSLGEADVNRAASNLTPLASWLVTSSRRWRC